MLPSSNIIFEHEEKSVVICIVDTGRIVVFDIVQGIFILSLKSTTKTNHITHLLPKPKAAAGDVCKG